MTTPNKFLTSSKPRTPIHPLFSPEETPSSLGKISPALFCIFANIFNDPNSLARIAKRQAGSKNEESSSEKDELTGRAGHNKGKFTGSPAFRELKNLIVTILTSQKGNS